MAVTENLYTGDGSTVLFSFSFPYISRSDVKVTLNGTATTAFTFATSTSLQFTTAPANGVIIRIYRDTDITSARSTFAQGSAIRAADLNNNFTQTRYTSQETKNNSWKKLSSDTLDSTATWASTDSKIPTTRSVEERLQDLIGSGDNIPTDSADVAYVPPGTGSVTRTVKSKLQDIVSVKDFGAVSDCTAQGVGTDVIPAILAAVNYAVTLGPGTKVVLPPGRYRAQTSATLNLGGVKFIELDFQGAITPDSTAMSVLTIVNGGFLTLNARVEGGGIFNGYLDANPYGPCDYTTTRDAAAAGGQEMFLIRGVSNYTVNLYARAYAGRVLRTDERTNVAHPQTVAIKGRICTERASDLSLPRVAQALWADGGTTAPNSGNWGGLERLVCDFDAYGPVWKRLNDIDIGTIDAAFGGEGPKFLGCKVITGNTWYVGDTDGGSGSRHVQFISSDGTICEAIDVKYMRFLNKGPGLWMDSVKHAFFHADVLGTNHGDVVTLVNCEHINGTVSSYGTGSRLLNISGSSTNLVKMDAISTNATLSDDNILIASTVTGVVIIHPTIIGRTASKSIIKIDGAAQVSIVDPYLAGTNGNIFDISSATNNVNVYSGAINNSGVTVYEGGIKPIVIANTAGVNDQAISADLRANNGGNSAGEGGAIGFGISVAGAQQDRPMARVKGQLVNAISGEQQGNLALQIRPSGVSTQALIDAIVASNTTTNGEMLAVMLARIGGSYVSKRIKVGNTGTGPGGTGRALYVDD